MKKLAIIIVLALAGGGFYLYKYKPEVIEDIQSQVEDMIGGSTWKEVKKFKADFKKAKFDEGDEKQGYIRDYKDELTQTFFTDDNGSKLTLLSIGDDAVGLIFSYSESAEEGIAKYAKKTWKGFMGEEASFSGEGSKTSEKAIGYWGVDEGRISFGLYKADLEKVPAVAELSAEVKDALNAIRGILEEKVKMEATWNQLDDERHHCFEKSRFEAIKAEMQALKEKAEKLTEEFKKNKELISQAQLVQLQKEIDEGSIK